MQVPVGVGVQWKAVSTGFLVRGGLPCSFHGGVVTSCSSEVHE